ncbi:MAG: relaxase/mobilization nuclease domain-containing protein [Pseudomonadota bacterium]
MIIKAKERGNAAQLGRYLIAMRENDHVELHEVRGFVSDNIVKAFTEADAIAKGTRCKNHMFSISLNPPPDQNPPVEAFESAIGRIEGELGLVDHPRAIVFHEKDGRRHVHAVWSRIDGEAMRAINLPFYKQTLTGISRDLYREHGWQMPRGLADRDQRNPMNFSHSEWQQSKRTRQDPRAVKEVMREIWTGSDSSQAFETALEERGYRLARGDRRGFVVVDWRGEVYSLSRSTGAKTKEIKARLGDPGSLLPTDEVRHSISERMSPKLRAWAKEAQARIEKQNLSAKFQREELVQRQRDLRQQLREKHEERRIAEELARAERTPKGMRGLWGWITGKNKKIRLENEVEMKSAQSRDRAEKQAVIDAQLAERRRLKARSDAAREKQQERLNALNSGVAHYMKLGVQVPKAAPQKPKVRAREHNKDPGRGPNFTPN